MGFWTSIKEWFDSTHLHEQVADVDYIGLFTNPWFIIPFVIIIAYMLYKQQFKDIIIISILIGVWWVSGTDYMDTLIIGDELQIDKILPIVFGGAGVLGFVIYLLFGRSD